MRRRSGMDPPKEHRVSVLFVTGDTGSWNIEFSFGQFKKHFRYLGRAIPSAVKAGMR